MPQSPAQVTAAEISRLVGVTRATVSNWRRRHPDFPAPTGGTEASPAYDLDAIRAWLAARGQLPASTPADDLRAALRSQPAVSGTPTRLLPLVLAADRLDAVELKTLTELSDNRLPARAVAVIRAYADEVPGASEVTYRAEEVALLRALLHCVREEGPVPAADVLAERDTEESGVSGTYPTPTPLVELMADLLAGAGNPFPTSVFDPSCGAGGLLAAAARRGAHTLYGQDIVPAQAAQAAVRLGLLGGPARFEVRAGDSIRADAFPTLTAQAVLCNPPYGNRDWGHEELAYDPRWAYGLPAKGEPELAWVQHCLAHLAEGASAVLLMPPATAERAAGRRTRAELIRSGALRAVVALPAGAAAPLHIGLHLWLLRRPHPQATAAQSVLFVDSVGADSAQRTVDGPTLTGSAAAKRPAVEWTALGETVRGAWQAYIVEGDRFETVPGVARAVPVIDLLDESVDLTPARHVRVAAVAAQPDEYAETIRAIRAQLGRAASALAALSGGEDWPPSGAEPRSWRSATVADLLRGGALTLLRSTGASRGTSTRRIIDEHPAEEEIMIRPGDVLLPELLQSGPHTTRVAEARDAGQPLGRNRYLLRPDPERLDPWFLAGFLAAEENVHAAATGTSIVRIDARRLRLPLLPLDEQRRYGTAFRQLHELRTAAELANRLAEETARALGAGLTGGALLPPDADRPPG